MDMTEILRSEEGALGRLTLNRPKALNALTQPMCEAIFGALRDWASASNIAAVLMDAVPGRAFCAGGDMRAIYELGKANDPAAMAFFGTEYAMNQAIAEFVKPYVAILDGLTMGGGVGISVHGEFRVATENSVLAMPETAIGFFPDIGGSYFLPRLPGELGTYLGLTGVQIGAADMIYTGLATHFVFSARTKEIAPHLVAGEPVHAVLASLSADAGPSKISARRDAIDRAFSASTVEEIILALTKEGEWGAETAALLSARSPTSLKVTLSQLRKGAQLDLRHCLEMELGIAGEMLRAHDLYEGVRTILVAKDHTPHWEPARLEDVSDAMIARYFV
jgi:enoyl-CoA hydratase